MKSKVSLKRLNHLLPNGLFVISSKKRNDSPYAKLAVTDLNQTLKIIFDVQEKRIIGNTFDVQIPEDGAKFLAEKISA
jgi:hypothetical protein